MSEHQFQRRTLPDGALIEWGYSGDCAGPFTGGQHYGTSWLYFRVNGGEWRRSHEFRNWLKLSEWCDLCDNLADFESYVEGRGTDARTND